MSESRSPSLSSVLDDSRSRWGARAAVHSGGSAYSYEEFWRMSRQVQSYLSKRGVTSGDRIAWLLPNGVEAAAICFGGLGIGGVLVPMNPLLSEREIGHYLSDSGAAVLFASPERCDELAGSLATACVRPIPVDDRFWAECAASDPEARAVPVDPADPAYIIYTSGTTGIPKGVVLSHANLLQNVAVAAELNATDENDVIFGGLPLTHIFGQSCALHCAVRVGAAVTLEARFDAAEALRSIRRNAVSVFVGVPTMFVGLLSELSAQGIERLDSSLRVMVSGGAALPLDVVEEVEAKLGAVVLESYGLTEAAGYVLSERSEHVEADRRAGSRVAGSVGTPVPGCEVRIVDASGTPLGAGEAGELQVRGGNVMLEYWGSPEATAAVFDDGWLRTGDLSYRDQAGRYFIIGRQKELIVRGGYNVHPREVEEVLYAHPLVQEAAVLGRPDERLGEEIIAAVVLRNLDGRTREEAVGELRAYAKQNLAAYKYPRSFKVFDRLPKNSTGKILKTGIPIF